MIDFYIKQNDTSPAIAATLQDDAGNAIDLTGASVNFHMIEQDSATVKVDAAATIVSEANGQVKYNWIAADTDTVGVFNAEWEVTYADTTIETFPNNEHLKINIVDDIT